MQTFNVSGKFFLLFFGEVVLFSIVKRVNLQLIQNAKSSLTGLSIRAGSRPKQPATGKTLAGYFRITLLLILVRNLK